MTVSQSAGSSSYSADFSKRDATNNTNTDTEDEEFHCVCGLKSREELAEEVQEKVDKVKEEIDEMIENMFDDLPRF